MATWWWCNHSWFNELPDLPKLSILRHDIASPVWHLYLYLFFVFLTFGIIFSHKKQTNMVFRLSIWSYIWVDLSYIPCNPFVRSALSLYSKYGNVRWVHFPITTYLGRQQFRMRLPKCWNGMCLNLCFISNQSSTAVANILLLIYGSTWYMI